MMNKVPKVIWLYDDRQSHEIGLIRHIMYTFSGKERIVYKICVTDQRNKPNLKYLVEYGHYIPNSIGSALFRYFKDRVENVYQDS